MVGTGGDEACEERGKEAMPAPPLVVKVFLYQKNDAGMANS